MKKPGEKGYKARSIDKDIEAFCGWNFLIKLIKACVNPFERGLIAGLFETGCRVSELNQLTKKHVNLKVHPKLVVMEHVPVIKRYSRKLKKRFKAYRTFAFRRDEPLAFYFIYWVRNCPSNRLYPYSRVRIFQIVREIGSRLGGKVPFSNISCSQLYPHWFRAQRARQLRHDYKFTDEELRDWFGWKMTKAGMPAIYGKSSWMEQAEKMGVRVHF